MYGHSIPWKPVKRTNIVKQISAPDVASTKSKLDVLQARLFRSRHSDERPPKIINKLSGKGSPAWKKI